MRGAGLLLPGEKLSLGKQMRGSLRRVIKRKFVLQAPGKNAQAQSQKRKAPHALQEPVFEPTMNRHRDLVGV